MDIVLEAGLEADASELVPTLKACNATTWKSLIANHRHVAERVPMGSASILREVALKRLLSEDIADMLIRMGDGSDSAHPSLIFLYKVRRESDHFTLCGGTKLCVAPTSRPCRSAQCWRKRN